MSSRNETQALTTGDFLENAWSRDTALADERDDLVGVTLNGTYVVERVLGEGGMGRVYQARHTRIAQKRVAVKVLHDEYSRNEEVLQRFQREAEAAAAVSHPNVMSVLDVDRTPSGAPYLVCEYLEGIDLAAHLKNVGKLSTEAALHLARALCHGLAAAHARSVIHRDLKPQNIFLIGDLSRGAAALPDVKILDFGLSRFLDSCESESLTKTGYIMGTPAYMAPEQARGLRVDQRVDIYGLGAILYTALTGRPPFEADTPQATVLAVVSSEPPRPRSLVPSIPVPVELLLERALAREPDERYPDMTRFLEAVENLALDAPRGREKAASRAEPDEPAVPDQELSAARPRLVLYLGLMALLIVGGAITAVTGLELSRGYGFNRVELRLLLLAILGISLTPAMFWLARIRSHVWHKSSRVLSLLGHLRAAVVVGAATYGVLALGLRFADDFLVRLLDEPWLRPLGASWPGWNLPLACVAFSMSLAVVVRRVLASSMRAGFARALLRTLVLALSLALALGFLYVGFRWHARVGPGAAELAPKLR